ncbi:hypothetical protein CLOP_g15753, partial [Closterium sp. NIES-67]
LLPIPLFRIPQLPSPPAAAAPAVPPPPAPAAATSATTGSLLPGPSVSAAVTPAEMRLKPDELFEAWCNGSYSRVLHNF